MEKQENQMATLTETVNAVGWKQKLTSRKFWAAILAFITPLLIAFNFKGLTPEQVEAIIWGTAGLIAYIVGEGLVDAARVNATKVNEQYVYNEQSEDKGEVILLSAENDRLRAEIERMRMQANAEYNQSGHDVHVPIIMS